jgi:hypothetical protein
MKTLLKEASLAGAGSSSAAAAAGGGPSNQQPAGVSRGTAVARIASAAAAAGNSNVRRSGNEYKLLMRDLLQYQSSGSRDAAAAAGNAPNPNGVTAQALADKPAAGAGLLKHVRARQLQQGVVAAAKRRKIGRSNNDLPAAAAAAVQQQQQQRQQQQQQQRQQQQQQVGEGWVEQQELEQLYMKEQQQQEQRQQQQQELDDQVLLDMLYAAEEQHQQQQQQLGEEQLLDLLYIRNEEQQQQQVQGKHLEEQIGHHGDRAGQPPSQQQRQGLEANAVKPAAAAAAGGAAAAAAAAGLPGQRSKRGVNLATFYMAVDGTRIWLKVS